MDITKQVLYEECGDINGKFILLSFKGIPIAEIRLREGWLEEKKIDECFKVFYCENHPIDYVWVNKNKK
mgnify:CR=1 FL=1